LDFGKIWKEFPTVEESASFEDAWAQKSAQRFGANLAMSTRSNSECFLYYLTYVGDERSVTIFGAVLPLPGWGFGAALQIVSAGLVFPLDSGNHPSQT
jgi:hypothetical protein